jgi:hypothetical protein
MGRQAKHARSVEDCGHEEDGKVQLEYEGCWYDEDE